MRSDQLRGCLLILPLMKCLVIIFATDAVADEMSLAPEGTFSIVVIPDTQQYYGEDTKRGPLKPNTQEAVTNAIFQTETDWIIANLEKQRVVFVSHVGDVVDRNNRTEWMIARQCMDKLHGRVPYGISVGNHDMVERTGNSSLFQEFFPSSRFEGRNWYGGHFSNPDKSSFCSSNNANSFQLFSAEGIDFLVLHLECNAPDNVLEWADSILDKHSSRRAMITTHMDIGPVTKPNPEEQAKITVGRMTWKKCHGKNGNSYEQMWQKCFCKHAHLFLICCGDQSQSQAAYQSVRGLNGNLVHEVLSDYMTLGLRVMRFIPLKNQIEVRTWNTVEGKPCLTTEKIPNQSEHQFTLNFEMNVKE